MRGTKVIDTLKCSNVALYFARLCLEGKRSPLCSWDDESRLWLFLRFDCAMCCNTAGVMKLWNSVLLWGFSLCWFFFFRHGCASCNMAEWFTAVRYRNHWLTYGHGRFIWFLDINTTKTHSSAPLNSQTCTTLVSPRVAVEALLLLTV